MSERFPLKDVLPSGLKLYPKVKPEEVTIGVLSGKDEKLISEMTIENSAKKFVAVLKNVLTGIDPLQLTLGDERYILLWLAINSYSKIHTMATTCEGCGRRLTVDVDMSEFENMPLVPEFIEPYKVTLSDGTVQQVRLLRVADEVKIIDYEKQNGTSWLYRFALSLVDDKTNIVDKMNMLEKLKASDLALIRVVQDKFEHGPVMQSNYECAACGFSGVVPVPFRLEMLFPYGDALKKTFGARV